VPPDLPPLTDAELERLCGLPLIGWLARSDADWERTRGLLLRALAELAAPRRPARRPPSDDGH
jgi:hypothetical protein